MDKFFFILEKDNTTRWDINYNNSYNNKIFFERKVTKIKKHIIFVKEKHENQYNIDEYTKYNKNHIPMIKSVFQKYIRRQMIDKALKTAKLYISLDLVGFLRRLIIICCEDVFLCKKYTNTLIWYYICIKLFSYKISYNDYNFLLNFVKNLCIDKRYINPNFIDNENINFSKINKYNFKRNNKNIQFLLGITLFYTYTDFFLEGDRNMFKYIIEKYDNDTEIYELNWNYDNDLFNNIKFLTFDEYDLFGIDFHNFSFIINFVYKCICKEYDDEYSTKNEIKIAIWNCRSGINFRKNDKIDKNLLDFYEKIEKYIDKVCLKIKNDKLL